jgi:hypothetical protein
LGKDAGDQSTQEGAAISKCKTRVDKTAMTDTTATPVFTATSAFSIAGVFGALAFAYVGLVKLLPKTASRTDRITFVWLVSDLNSG